MSRKVVAAAVALTLMPLVAACSRRGDRDREFQQCVDIYRTTYVAGKVSDCLTQRYGWSKDDALKAERDRLGGTTGADSARGAHPDSASRGDSGRMGDSAPR